jgi:hypothetical protein
VEGQRDLGRLREGRVAAGEDEREPVVVARCRFGLAIGREQGQLLLAGRPAPDRVEGLAPGGRDEPPRRIRRHAFVRPVLESLRERILQCLLGPVEVTEPAREHAQHARGVRSPHPVGRRRRVRHTD